VDANVEGIMGRPLVAALLALVLLTSGGLALVATSWMTPAAAASLAPSRVYFPQTGHYLSYGFLDYWQTNGGIPIFGYPITEEMSRNGLTVQYFERAVFEYHANAPAGWKVQLERLGAEQTASRTGEIPFKPVAAANNASTTFFPQTGHRLAFGFRAYWEQNSGLRIFGYPISEEFSENGYTVQYFERARFEYHPQSPVQYQIQLGLLGDAAAQAGVNRAPLAPNADVPNYNPSLWLSPAMHTEPNGITIGCTPGQPNQYLTCEAQEPGGFALTFYLFLPQGYSTGTNYPLVLLLEGSGERADANKSAAENRNAIVTNPYAQVFGPGYHDAYSQNVQGNWPSFVVIPQLVNPARFVDVPGNHGSYAMAPQPNSSLRMSKQIVDTLQLVYPNIDARRLYVTGLSMGGYGAWEAAERGPNYGAAAAPIAGAGDPSYASRLVNLPLWAFHSADDSVVPVSGSRDMVQAIRAAGGQPKYTEYSNLGHGCWLAPYTIIGRTSPTPDFFPWLFAQRK
jgi:hypothetical protein